jgi:hypothetical protein
MLACAVLCCCAVLCHAGNTSSTLYDAASILQGDCGVHEGGCTHIQFAGQCWRVAVSAVFWSTSLLAALLQVMLQSSVA